MVPQEMPTVPKELPTVPQELPTVPQENSSLENSSLHKKHNNIDKVFVVTCAMGDVSWSVCLVTWMADWSHHLYVCIMCMYMYTRQ